MIDVITKHNAHNRDLPKGQCSSGTMRVTEPSPLDIKLLPIDYVIKNL